MKLAGSMNIRTCFAHSHHYPATKSYTVSHNHCHTLTFRASGTKIFHLADHPKPLVSAPDSITYMPRGVPYRVDDFETGHMYAVHFELNEEVDAKPFVFTPHSPIEYENRFRTLAETSTIDNDRDYRTLSLIYELLAMISAELEDPDRTPVPRRIRSAVEQINRRYDDPALSVAELAADAGVSEVWFRREFAACMGMPPIRYIRKIRLETARALLGTALYSIGEVATRCGFDSISYFSALFSRVYGMPPSDYVKNAAVKHNEIS